jgi:zinc protease
METIIRQSLKEFEKRGVTDDDINRFKAGYEANEINGLASVSGKVSQLAYYQTITGNPNNITVQLKKYMSVTKADVMRVYNQYIKGKKGVILSIIPKGQQVSPAAPDNYKVSKEGYKTPDYGYEGLKYVKAKDNFDRSKRPAPGKNPVVKVPPFWTDSFANGIKVIGTKNEEIPTVTLLFTIQGGHRLSALEPSKAGIASLTASLMNEDTENYTAEQMSNELEKLGSSISVSSGPENYTVVVQSLKKNLDATLKLLEERLYRPKFAPDDFDRLKNQQLEGIANQNTQPTVIASKVYNKLLFGEDNIRSIPQSGTEETVKNITVDDVKNFYQKYFSPTVTNLVIVGDVEQGAIMPKLSFLNKWEKKDVTVPAAAPSRTIDKTKIYLVDKEKAPQSEIRVGYVALPFDATGDFYKSNIMNYPLGGAFNSRINLNLREDKGYTYGARSYFSGTKSVGPFTSAAGVRADVTDSALVEIVKEITNFRDKGITEAELAFTKSSSGQDDALEYETGFQKAGFLNQIIYYNLENDFVDKQNEILKNITKAEIDALAKKYLPIEKMHMLVVGDKELVKPKLEKLGYDVVELDKEGNEVTPQITPAPAEPASETPAGAASPGAEKKKKGKK